MYTYYRITEYTDEKGKPFVRMGRKAKGSCTKGAGLPATIKPKAFFKPILRMRDRLFKLEVFI